MAKSPSVISNSDIKEALERKPQLPHPFNVAVYFAPQKRPQYNSYQKYEWSWNAENKESFLKSFGQLKEKGIYRQISTIPESLIDKDDNNSVRLAAAKMGADAVIIINGGIDTDYYNNASAATYMLVLPLLFVPGSQFDTLFLADATMWDVRNEYLYITSEAEAGDSQLRPAVFIDEKSAIDNAKSNAVQRLGDEFAGRLARIR